ncbi:MAG: tetratricopeptide repeat protein [Thermoanaerobaculia bacterium]
MITEEKRRLYTEHAPEAVAAISRVLAAPGPSPVLVLAGPPGCGRTGLLEAAADQATAPVAVLPLDLEGFEENAGLERFAEIQIARRRDLDEAGKEALRASVQPLMGFLPATLPGAALLSLLLRQDDPAAAWKELPAAAAGDARPALSELLARAGGEGRILLHADSAQLSDPFRRWLLDETRKNPSLVLAISCAASDIDELAAPRSERLRLELTPPPAEGLLEPVQELLHDLELETSDRLQRFLDLAALCGEDVPAELLFHHLELDEDEREEILDLIDDELVENEESRIFLDHQYGHPSFPGLLTYAFVSPAIRHALLEPVPAAKRERLAGELLEFLNRSVPLHTRGMTLLRLSLAGFLEDGDARRFFQREMRVWIGEEETADLTAELADSLAAGRANVRDLLATVQQTQGQWPAHRRLAFLDAARGQIVSLAPEERVELYNIRAEVLRELGRLPESVEESGMALEESRKVHGAEHPATTRALNLRGILLREAGRYEEAREALEQALSIHGRDKEDANLASILANLGTVLRDLGRQDEARENLERALALHRQAFGDQHPTVATGLTNLATLERELGQPQKALDYLRPTVDIIRGLYGDVHPETARTLTNVASLLRELGELNAARLHVDAALEIDRQAYGDTHPQVIADLNNLAILEKELGEPDQARDHLEQALALSRQVLGEDHALTAQLRDSLGGG